MKGTIHTKSEEITKWVSVDNPTLYFVHMLKENLTKNGILVKGKPVDARDTGYVLNRNRSFQISSHKSLPLGKLTNDFLKYSINLHGESILKMLTCNYPPNIVLHQRNS